MRIVSSVILLPEENRSMSSLVAAIYPPERDEPESVSVLRIHFCGYVPVYAIILTSPVLPSRSTSVVENSVRSPYEY